MTGAFCYLHSGNTVFASKCNAAFKRGQDAMDKYLWNSTLGFYLAYKQMPGEALPSGAVDSSAPIMTDSFYAQVCLLEQDSLPPFQEISASM